VIRLALRLLGLATLLGVVAVACASAGSPSTGTTVSMKGFAFAPTQLNATKGAVVTWTNEDTAPHTVTSGTPGSPSGKFDQQVDAGKTFTFTFADAGTFDFFCKIHTNMKGQVVVK
jgi:plastocyanin